MARDDRPAKLPAGDNTQDPPGESGKSTARGVTRRTLLRRAAIVGGTLAGGAALEACGGGTSPARSTLSSEPVSSPPPAAAGPPNILVVMVDQLRQPQWFPAQRELERLLPNISALRRRSVSFERHYTAANDCTPSRGALLTGLYPHQTGCMITGRSTLDPGFPTWGTQLREHSYSTNWFGKWHVTRGDNHWTVLDGAPSLESYGFANGTFPSPNGGPGQGLIVDPRLAGQFERWLSIEGARAPWCTTVSFVNPHDIAWWPRLTNQRAGERSAPSVFGHLPPNFETPADFVARRKPSLQQAFSDTTARTFGAVPFSGPEAQVRWTSFMDLYLYLQQLVDVQVGRVLRALASSDPQVAANTIVIFTADHGEYGGSHGLRGKGGSAYEEAVRVPLYVHDPRAGVAATQQPRQQLTSSVDLSPLLLTLATGSGEWRQQSRYSHLAKRADLAAILKDPAAAGREAIIHVTDEIATEYAPTSYARHAPRHVIAMRTREAKYVTYSRWREQTQAIDSVGQERELYDYSTPDGRLELENQAGRSPLEDGLDQRMQAMIREELRAPLPAELQAAGRRGFADYVAVLPPIAEPRQHRSRGGGAGAATVGAGPRPQLGR